MRITGPAVVVLAAAVMLPAAGCASASGARDGGAAGGRASPTATTTPAPAASSSAPQSAIAQLCGPPNGPGRFATIRAADGTRLSAIEAGQGKRGVVLVPELGNLVKCGWWPYAAFLATHGFHVLLFDHRCTGSSACPAGKANGDLMSDIRGAVARLRHAGVTRIVLMGASQGGSEVLIAGARPAAGVTGIVALSADVNQLPLAAAPYPATATAAVARLRLPVFFAVASTDPYVTVAATRGLLARSGSARKHLDVLPATAGHGWDMVSPPPSGGAVPAFGLTVLGYLRSLTS